MIKLILNNFCAKKLTITNKQNKNNEEIKELH